MVFIDGELGFHPQNLDLVQLGHIITYLVALLDAVPEHLSLQQVSVLTELLVVVLDR